MGVVYYDGDAARTRAALLEGFGAIAGVDPNDSALAFLERTADQAFTNRLRAASRFHTRADNLRTAAAVLEGEGVDLEHHLSEAIKIVEQGGRA